MENERFKKIQRVFTTQATRNHRSRIRNNPKKRINNAAELLADLIIYFMHAHNFFLLLSLYSFFLITFCFSRPTVLITEATKYKENRTRPSLMCWILHCFKRKNVYFIKAILGGLTYPAYEKISISPKFNARFYITDQKTDNDIKYKAFTVLF